MSRTKCKHSSRKTKQEQIHSLYSKRWNCLHPRIEAKMTLSWKKISPYEYVRNKSLTEVTPTFACIPRSKQQLYLVSENEKDLSGQRYNTRDIKGETVSLNAIAACSVGRHINR